MRRPILIVQVAVIHLISRSPIAEPRIAPTGAQPVRARHHPRFPGLHRVEGQDLGHRRQSHVCSLALTSWRAT